MGKLKRILCFLGFHVKLRERVIYAPCIRCGKLLKGRI